MRTFGEMEKYREWIDVMIALNNARTWVNATQASTLTNLKNVVSFTDANLITLKVIREHLYTYPNGIQPDNNPIETPK